MNPWLATLKRGTLVHNTSANDWQMAAWADNVIYYYAPSSLLVSTLLIICHYSIKELSNCSNEAGGTHSRSNSLLNCLKYLLVSSQITDHSASEKVLYTWYCISTRTYTSPILFSFLLPSWCAIWSYQPHLEETGPIWGDEWSHSPFIWRSSSWGSGAFLSCKANARRSVHSPWDHSIITLIISDRRDIRG